MADRKQELQKPYPQTQENYPSLATIFLVKEPVRRMQLLNAFLDEYIKKDNQSS